MDEIMRGTAEGLSRVMQGNERMTEAYLRRLEREGVEPEAKKRRTEDKDEVPRQRERNEPNAARPAPVLVNEGSQQVRSHVEGIEKKT